MKLEISKLTTDRKWRSVLGLDEKRFYLLLDLFEEGYKIIHGTSIEARLAANPNQNFSLQTYEELLFYTLFSLKSGLTYDVLGFVSGMDGSNAKRNQKLGLEILQYALKKGGYLPKRNFANVKEFKSYFNKKSELILDGVEQRTQRPSDYEEQKDYYSGKKKDIQ
jgi:hypothetical protein